MTTPAANSTSSIDVSDVTDELNPGTPSNQIQNLAANSVVKQLGGTFVKSYNTSEISLGSDLSNKTAFSEIIAVTQAPVVTGNPSSYTGPVDSSTWYFYAQGQLRVGDPGPLLYQWEYYEDILLPWQILTNETNPGLAVELTTAAYDGQGYRCKITSSTTGLFVYTNTATITIDPEASAPSRPTEHGTPGSPPSPPATAELTAVKVGNTANVTVVVTANSDMYDPTMTWSYTIDSGSSNTTTSDITVEKITQFDSTVNRPAGIKSAKITLATPNGTKTANLTVTGVMTVPSGVEYYANGLVRAVSNSVHTVNTCTKNVKLTLTAANAAFQVTTLPSASVSAIGAVAQTASITLKASSNTELSSNTRYRFTPTKLTGSVGPYGTLDSKTVDTSDSTITFTVVAPTFQTRNTATYSVLTEMLYNNEVVESNTIQISLLAQFIDRQITSLTAVGGVTTNNAFSNGSSQYATIDIIATHDAVAPTYTQGTLEFTYATTGSAITTQLIASNSSSRTERISLYHDFAAEGYQIKESVVTVVATLRDPNGRILDQKAITQNDFEGGLILRAGSYGLNLQQPVSNTKTGYAAQTAISTSVATWSIPNASFIWQTRKFNGGGPISTVTNDSRTSTLNITATTPSGKNISQNITNTASFDITGVLKYGNTTVVEKILDTVNVTAETLKYISDITSVSQTDTAFSVSGIATASLLTTVTHDHPSGYVTFSLDNGSVGFTNTSTSTTATINTFVTSQSTDSSNVQTVTVTAQLYDSSARLVEVLTTPPLTLDAVTHPLTVRGDSLTRTEKLNPLNTTQSFEVSESQYATTTLDFPPQLLSSTNPNGLPAFNDDGLFLAKDSDKKLRITAIARIDPESQVGSTTSGTYRITARANYKGIERQATKDVTVAADLNPVDLKVYKLTSNVLSISEQSPSSGVRFTLDTINVDNDTVVPFTISGAGITTGDITPSVLSGSFTIQSNTATYDLYPAQDFVTENNELLVLTLTSNSTNLVPPNMDAAVRLVDILTKDPITNSAVQNANGYIKPQIGTVVVGATQNTIADSYIVTTIVQTNGANVVAIASGGNASPTARARVVQNEIGSNSATFTVAFNVRYSNGVFVTARQYTNTISATVNNPQFRFSETTSTPKVWNFTVANNSFNYPEPVPSQVTYSESQSYQASAATDIPNKRFVFSADGAVASQLTQNQTTGALTVTGIATYTDPSGNGSANFDLVPFTIQNCNENLGVKAEVYSGNIIVDGPLVRNKSFGLSIPSGRIFRLATFAYGPRFYHTRDAFGNSSEQLDYSRLPSSGSYTSGPEIKWLGFHSQTVNFTNFTAGGGVTGQLYDPNASTSKPRPLYDSSNVRYYSSTSHRTAHGSEQPNVIIPEDYFMVMSFSETGTARLGDIFLIGSDNELYGPLQLHNFRLGQNDRSRNNDSFDWYIYKCRKPSGVTFDYCIISNGNTNTKGKNVFDTQTNITITPGNLSNVQITDYVNLFLGSIDGGNDGTGGDSGGGIRDLR